MLNYRPGDELYIFGFSRGAYTARSLCGLIRNAGILRRGEFERTPEAIDPYRSKLEPYDRSAQEFRRQHSYNIIAGPEDYTDADRETVQEFGRRAGAAEGFRVIPPQIRERGISIRFLGIWETVGALGVPARFRILKWLTPERYRFHDTDASTLVQRLRHAVSLDEERAAFDVAPFSNIDELNLL